MTKFQISGRSKCCDERLRHSHSRHGRVRTTLPQLGAAAILCATYLVGCEPTSPASAPIRIPARLVGDRFVATPVTNSGDTLTLFLDTGGARCVPMPSMSRIVSGWIDRFKDLSAAPSSAAYFAGYVAKMSLAIFTDFNLWFPSRTPTCAIPQPAPPLG
jgi:hypothetical protein